jgi:hypothetical protein
LDDKIQIKFLLFTYKGRVSKSNTNKLIEINLLKSKKREVELFGGIVRNNGEEGCRWQ